MTSETTIHQDTELADTLTAISVISKHLASKLQEDGSNEPDETTE